MIIQLLVGNMDLSDDRLSKIENLLVDMDERQTLTRFDTILFLSYPLVLLGITMLANLSQQFGILANVIFIGLNLGIVLLSISFLLGVFGAVFFIFFLYGYIKDDLHDRLFACRNMVFVLGGLIVAFLSGGAALLIRPLLVVSSSVLSGDFAFGISSLLVLSLASCELFFLDGVASTLVERILRWFDMALPRRVAAEAQALGYFRTSNSPKVRHRIFMAAKVFWVVTCGIYGVLVFLNITKIGVGGMMVYYLFGLFCLLLATLVVFNRDKIGVFWMKLIQKLRGNQYSST